MADYIPAKNTEFFEWVKNFAALCAAHQERWTLPVQEVADLCTAVTEYTAGYETLYETETSPEKGDNQKKEVLAEQIRDFSRRNIDRNGAITDAERERLRIDILSSGASLSGAPEFDFTYPGAGRLEVHYHGGGRQAKPKGAAGAMLSYAIRDVPPKSQELLLHSVFTIQTPYHFAFAEEERGRILYVALRWLNHKGEAGPWSEIRRAIIP
ncbi:MAG: hypothetical protein LBG73_04200 [Spirochaetaceae bacterium]|jgi:hypothetical protein|nr:hypothetical protein [Spirochaetaceae bacterium]